MAKNANDAGAVVVLAKAGATLDQRITNVINRSNKLGPDIHGVAVDCLIHAQEHSDPRKLDRLVKGLHTSCRPETLRAWVSMYSPIVWNGDDKVGMLKATAKKYVPFNIDDAKANPYYALPENVKVKELTLEAMMAIIDKMAKKFEEVRDGEKDNYVIGENENVVKMAAFVENMQAAKNAFAAGVERAA